MMKNYMNKTMAVMMAGLMAISMAACGQSSTADSTEAAAEATTEYVQIANPVTEVPEEEMVEQTGIDLPAPDGAENVKYFIIDTGDHMIAEMTFTLDGRDFYLRSCYTDQTEIDGTACASGAANGFDVASGNISGLYYDWTSGGQAQVDYCTGYMYVSEEGAGFIAWLDVVPGVLYNLCMTEGADPDILADYANDVFVPLQGDAEGDAEAETGEVSEAFSNLLENIYATKAGTPGSSERVTAASVQLRNFVAAYGDKFNAQSAEALALEILESMKEDKDNFKDNFKECFTAVVDQATDDDKNLETDVTFNQIVNGIQNALDQL